MHPIKDLKDMGHKIKETVEKPFHHKKEEEAPKPGVPVTEVPQGAENPVPKNPIVNNPPTKVEGRTIIPDPANPAISS